MSRASHQQNAIMDVYSNHPLVLHSALFLVFTAIVVLLHPGNVAAQKNIPKQNDRHLQSIIISLSSQTQLKDLRKYPIEIVAVRPTNNMGSAKKSLHIPQIIEAVATSETIKKLQEAGYSVCQAPCDKNKLHGEKVE